MERARSPFPGMDPYLEHPARWRDVHSALVTYLRDDLQLALPARYYAAMEDRVYVDSGPYGIGPDVRVVDQGAPLGAWKPAPSGADTALVVEVQPVEIDEHFIEIRDAESGDRVVAVIEFLSPANKRPSGDGAKAYRAKQAQILASRTNLIEIDLLRGGEHVVCVPRELLARAGPYHYLAVIRRGLHPGYREVYPISLRSRLPRIPVPLLPPDADVVADLQSIVERAYEGGAYAKRTDYTNPPNPPLGAADEGWAREITARPR